MSNDSSDGGEPAQWIAALRDFREVVQPVAIGIHLVWIGTDGQFDVVWDSRTPVRPIPYPVFRDREAWDQFLDDLRRGWGGRWENPER